MTVDATLPGSLNGDRQWMKDGLCVGAKNDDWFPNYDGDPEPGSPAYDAQQICGVCPVRKSCRDYALEQGVDHGIWGGLTERQRRQIRRRNRTPRKKVS